MTKHCGAHTQAALSTWLICHLPIEWLGVVQVHLRREFLYEVLRVRVPDVAEHAQAARDKRRSKRTAVNRLAGVCLVQRVQGSAP